MKKLTLPILLVLLGVLSLLYYFIQPGSSGNLDVKIQHTDLIMPAAYKVYGNKNALNGKYYLFKMLITNTGKKTVRDVKVKYNIPGYIDWTELNKISYLYPGQSVVIACYPKFKDDIVNKMTQSQEKADIQITSIGNKEDEIDESFGFTMLGRNGIAYTSIPASEINSYRDNLDNIDLLPCFVMPNDPIVRYFTQKIQQKVLKGDVSDNKDPKDCVRFLLGIYKATRMAHMVYSGTSGLPGDKIGDITAYVQKVRLPREVITGRTGQCIELSLLYASILESAGLHAIIFTKPQHAFPGFKLDGGYWAIESTAIGGAGIGGSNTAEQALELGHKELVDELQHIAAGDQGYRIVNIDKLNSEGVIPMEMKDNDFMRKEVDEIAKSFVTHGYKKPNQRLGNNGNNDLNKNAGNNFNQAMATYNGLASFNYPANWNGRNEPNPQFPILLTMISSPDKMASAEVYQINGTHNSAQALNYLQQLFYAHGIQIQYSYAGTEGNNKIYRGQTQSSMGTYQWIGVVKPIPSGVAFVVAGANVQAYNQYQNTLNSIINSVR